MEGDSMNDRLHLPAPSPYSGPNRCGSSLGAGITGVRYEMALPAVNVGGVLDPDGTVLVVDEICDACQGCGRAAHTGCRWDEHADPEAVGFDFDPGERGDLNDDEEPDEHECLSCGGRRWFPVQGFNEQRATVLRVPCGCAEGLLVEAS
jgi:hypothetical protein